MVMRPDVLGNALDSIEKPSIDIENVGQQMAERVSSFVKEDSEFSKIETEGPINFNYDKFIYSLEHFLDSSDENHEEEINEVDEQLIDQISDEEGKIIQILGTTGADPSNFVENCLNESLESQPTESGPTSDLMNLFELKKKEK